MIRTNPRNTTTQYIQTPLKINQSRSPSRRDFFDPDFGVKASLKLASRERSNCQLGAEADSEIPELGLDSGRLNVDCQLNPMRVANAAYDAVKQYGKYRHRPQSSRVVKRKRTRINIDRDYVRSKHSGDDDEEDEGEAGGDQPRSSRQQVAVADTANEGPDDDDDDD